MHGHAAALPPLLLPAPMLLDLGMRQVYDSDTAQKDIFDITARPIIDAVLDGYNGGRCGWGEAVWGGWIERVELREDVQGSRSRVVPDAKACTSGHSRS